MAAASALALSPPPRLASLSLATASKPRHRELTRIPAAPVFAPVSRSKRPLLLPTPRVGISPENSRLWTAAAASGDAVPSKAIVEEAQKIAVPAAADDGAASTIVSVLLFTAFVGLSILTVGVIYIAVTDFLQKREREKFEKEEAAKKNKGGKKAKAKVRAGPRGFGQKVEEEEDDDDAV